MPFGSHFTNNFWIPWSLLKDSTQKLALMVNKFYKKARKTQEAKRAAKKKMAQEAERREARKAYREAQGLSTASVGKEGSKE